MRSWRLRFPDPARRDLVLRNFAARVQSSMSKAIRAATASPMVRNENCIGPDRPHNGRLDGDLGTPGCHGHPVAVLNSMLRCKTWMDFDKRFGALIGQRTDPPCLRSR